MLPIPSSFLQPSNSRVLQLATDLILVGWKQLEMGDVPAAQRKFRRARELCPASSTPLEALGHAARRMGDLRTSLACAEEVIAMDPSHVGAHLLAAQALFGLGREDVALTRLTGVLSAHPDHPHALYLLAHHGHLDDHEQLALLGQGSQHDAQTRRTLGLALANVYEHRGEPERASQAAASAQAFDTAVYRPQEHASFLASIRSSSVGLGSNQGGGLGSARPIFLVGMPQMGTRQVERSLTQETGIFAAGPVRALEHLARHLPRCVGAPYPRSSVALDSHTATVLATRYRQLANLPAGVEVWTERCPDAALYLPLALRLFPGARVVQVVRDPQAAAHCSQLTRFENGDAAYARRPADFLAHHAFEASLMAHFREALPLPIHTLRYEDLDADPLRTRAELCRSLGLGRDPEAA